MPDKKTSTSRGINADYKLNDPNTFPMTILSTVPGSIELFPGNYKVSLVGAGGRGGDRGSGSSSSPGGSGGGGGSGTSLINQSFSLSSPTTMVYKVGGSNNSGVPAGIPSGGSGGYGGEWTVFGPFSVPGGIGGGGGGAGVASTVGSGSSDNALGGGGGGGGCILDINGTSSFIGGRNGQTNNNGQNTSNSGGASGGSSVRSGTRRLGGTSSGTQSGGSGGNGGIFYPPSGNVFAGHCGGGGGGGWPRGGGGTGGSDQYGYPGTAAAGGAQVSGIVGTLVNGTVYGSGGDGRTNQSGSVVGSGTQGVIYLDKQPYVTGAMLFWNPVITESELVRNNIPGGGLVTLTWSGDMVTIALRNSSMYTRQDVVSNALSGTPGYSTEMDLVGVWQDGTTWVQKYQRSGIQPITVYIDPQKIYQILLKKALDGVISLACLEQPSSYTGTVEHRFLDGENCYLSLGRINVGPNSSKYVQGNSVRNFVGLWYTGWASSLPYPDRDRPGFANSNAGYYITSSQATAVNCTYKFTCKNSYPVEGVPYYSFAFTWTGSPFFSQLTEVNYFSGQYLNSPSDEISLPVPSANSHEVYFGVIDYDSSSVPTLRILPKTNFPNFAKTGAGLYFESYPLCLIYCARDGSNYRVAQATSVGYNLLNIPINFVPGVGYPSREWACENQSSLVTLFSGVKQEYMLTRQRYTALVS